MNLIRLFLICSWCYCASVYADEVKQWEISAIDSTLSFTGTQNDVPVTGAFKSFTGKITTNFTQYQKSSVAIVVQVNSISVSYAEIATLLITPDWFHVSAFPNATFKSTAVRQLQKHVYEVAGILTIKNKSLPTAIKFTIEESPKNHLLVRGRTVIKRSDFDVGVGEWANTELIKDDVTINFRIVAKGK